MKFKRVSKFQWEYLPLIFIYSNSKFQVTCRNTYPESWFISRLIPKEKPSKIITLSAHHLAHHKNTQTEYASWVLSKCAPRQFILAQKNAKSRDSPIQGCYLHASFKWPPNFYKEGNGPEDTLAVIYLFLFFGSAVAAWLSFLDPTVKMMYRYFDLK